MNRVKEVKELKEELDNLSYLIEDIVLLSKEEVEKEFEGADKFLLLSDLNLAYKEIETEINLKTLLKIKNKHLNSLVSNSTYMKENNSIFYIQLVQIEIGLINLTLNLLQESL